MYEVKQYELTKGIIRKLIVFKTANRVLGEYSLANKYLNIRRSKERNYEYNGEQYVNHVVRFLNFLLEYREMFFDLDYENITVDAAQAFLDFISTEPCRTGAEPKTPTIKNYRKSISFFLMNLKSGGICPKLENHFIMQRVDEKYKYIDYELNIYAQKENGGQCEVIRDCPEFFIDSLIQNARRYDPDIYMLISLQINAGLRPAEACNVRMLDSCYGAGYQVVAYDVDGKLKANSLTIDLRKTAYKRMLRRDGVRTGGIKKPRCVDVYYPFIDQLLNDINAYVEMSKYRVREDTRPLVTCAYKREGVHPAITYHAYYSRFKDLCYKHVFPELEKRGMIYEWYAAKLKEGKFGPHMLREYFTCRLVKQGVQWSQIMRYRGDKNVQSAIVYVLKGGAFEESILDTNQMICDEVRIHGNVVEKSRSIPFKF